MYQGVSLSVFILLQNQGIRCDTQAQRWNMSIYHPQWLVSPYRTFRCMNDQYQRLCMVHGIELDRLGDCWRLSRKTRSLSLVGIPVRVIYSPTGKAWHGGVAKILMLFMAYQPCNIVSLLEMGTWCVYTTELIISQLWNYLLFVIIPLLLVLHTAHSLHTRLHVPNLLTGMLKA